MAKVIIIGAGFAGINAAKKLGGQKDIEVTLIDRRNHHLFQPLLYQVAMAGLSPADIAVPIRNLFSKYKNIKVLQGTVTEIDHKSKKVISSAGDLDYDYLLVCCGANNFYFGNDCWEKYAPGLKTLHEATDIRKRVLKAFELAEAETDPVKRKALMTFVIVGGGPTGVELAGAIGEMSRYTLTKDFKNIDSKQTRIMLIEAGDRVLSVFDPKLSSYAARELEKLGVQIWNNSRVSEINENGVRLGDETINAATVLWAAGVRPSALVSCLPGEKDRGGRIIVNEDLSLPDAPDIYAAGDIVHFKVGDTTLPGLAPVAKQQGEYFAKLVKAKQKGKEIKGFQYFDKGSMATIGRSRAVLQTGTIKMTGFIAWLAWIFVHIFYLTGFKNKVFVVLQWAWSYLSYKRGSRLIVEKENDNFSQKQ